MNLLTLLFRTSLLPAVLAACALLAAQTPSATASAISTTATPADASASPANFIPPPKLTLTLILRKLHTTARILQITAHPDDEDGGMLALESWGKGATVMLLTLTRGEGGQNKVGSNFSDELGILRTLELLESDKYYGVEQRFTRVADFGFSKTADETFQKWHGHEVALADVVRVIREFQPDVIVSRFDGSPRDGHGNHQAAGILAREAFRAAADPKRFPEAGQPWQAKKLYTGNLPPGETPTVKLETTVVDPELGMSYAQLALSGLRHQLSQGAAGWQLPPGPRYSSYKLAETVLPDYKPEHEQDFLDGIDTSDLARQSRSDTKRSKAALESLMKGLQLDAKESGSNSVLVPGGRAAISATVTNSGRETITLHSIQLTIQGQPLPGDQKIARLKPGQAETIHASITVPANSVYTKPNFHRENRETDAVYTIENPASATLPLAPWPLTASAAYALDGGEGIVTATARDSKNSAVPLAIAPPFSISVEPESRIVPSNAGTAIELEVSALSNLPSVASGAITLDLPAGWRAQPPSQTIHFDHAGQQRQVKFQIFPKAQSEGRSQIRAVLTHNGKQYSEG